MRSYDIKKINRGTKEFDDTNCPFSNPKKSVESLKHICVTHFVQSVHAERIQLDVNAYSIEVI